MAVVLATPALAPETAAQNVPPEYFGTSDTNYHYISAEEFQPSGANRYIRTQSGFWRSDSPGGTEILAPLRLPSGALVDGFVVIYDDSELFGNIELALYRYWVGAFGATGGSNIAYLSFSESWAPGVRSTWVELDPDLTIRYYMAVALTTQSYVFSIDLPDSPDVRFRGVIIHWKRQISPAPAVQTFPDVAPGFWAFQEIEALAASEITTGFPDGTFRPTAPITRAQMATFLARALGLHWSP
jgi:hypothetical protein